MTENQDKANRRTFLAAAPGALAAAAFAGKEQQDRRASDIGPENGLLKDANPNVFQPPVTDHGEAPGFWSSFSVAHRRIQEGGWSRQVTVEEFPISKDIAGVNMRLTAGGVRELHWHAAAEWALMLAGKARITAIDKDGRSFVKDVGPNDLWFFPTGTPHSIQGLAPDGAEFVLVFDEGNFSEGNTTLLSDWTRHTPREVLAKNWGVQENALETVYSVPPTGRYIFQAPVPGPLEQDRRAAAGSGEPSPVAFDFAMSKMTPTKRTKSGEVRVIDSQNFPVAKIAAAHVIVKPGGLRELHWHQNADEWQYFVQGKGRMTVFFNGSKARTADFNAGDVGYVPKTFGHYVENTGDTDLIFIEMFKADRYQELSLSQWVTNTPPDLITQTLGIGKEILEAIPKGRPDIVPA